MKTTASLKLAILALFLSFGFQSFSQSPHSEVTLSAGISQLGLDYAFLFGETRRHIVELGLRIGDGNQDPGLFAPVGQYEGPEVLYHYVLNSDEKLNFSAGLGVLFTGDNEGGYISIPLTFRYKIEEHFRLRARLTSLHDGIEVKVLPSIGFGVAF